MNDGLRIYPIDNFGDENEQRRPGRLAGGEDVLSAVQNEPWYRERLLILVMGASGDLARTKTFPALHELWEANLLPRDTVIYGYGRSRLKHAGLRSSLRPALTKRVTARAQGAFIPQHDERIEQFLSICFYKQGLDYSDIQALLHVLEAQKFDNLLIYLAVPPHVFNEATSAVKKCLSQRKRKSCGFTRIALEKPFGHDFASCQKMLHDLERQGWDDANLFRIDHYLGKEMFHNILLFRRENPWLKYVWNKNVVQSVHIIWKETFGTDGRGGYFDDYGIIRDVMQNHLMQLLVLIALELPEDLSYQAIQAVKVAVLKSIREIVVNDVLVGQYVGYHDDPTVTDKSSITATYAIARCWVDLEMWKGVPFVLEAGKAVDETVCEVRLHLLGNSANSLVMRIQPEPSMFFNAVVKTPGFSNLTMSTRFGVDYGQSFTPDAYSRILLDALRGQQASFVSNEELLLSWKIFMSVLKDYETKKYRPATYQRGSAGPIGRASWLSEMGIERNRALPRSSL